MWLASDAWTQLVVSSSSYFGAGKMFRVVYPEKGNRDQQLTARDAWIKKQIAQSKQPNRSHQPSRAAARAITEGMQRFKSPRHGVPHAETTTPTTRCVRGHRYGGRTSTNGMGRAFSREAHQYWISMDRGWNVTREAGDNDRGKNSRTALKGREPYGGERSEDLPRLPKSPSAVMPLATSKTALPDMSATMPAEESGMPSADTPAEDIRVAGALAAMSAYYSAAALAILSAEDRAAALAVMSSATTIAIVDVNARPKRAKKNWKLSTASNADRGAEENATSIWRSNCIWTHGDGQDAQRVRESYHRPPAWS